MRRFSVVVAAVGLALALVPSPTYAQQAAGAADTRIKEHETFNLRGHLSLLVSAGYDLDVTGDVTKGTLDNNGVVIVTTHYPDVYYAVPVRQGGPLCYGTSNPPEGTRGLLRSV